MMNTVLTYSLIVLLAGGTALALSLTRNAKVPDSPGTQPAVADTMPGSHHGHSMSEMNMPKDDHGTPCQDMSNMPGHQMSSMKGSAQVKLTAPSQITSN